MAEHQALLPSYQQSGYALEERLRRRYLPSDNAEQVGGDVDNSVDKYDYVLCFPNQSAPAAAGEGGSTDPKAPPAPRVTYKECVAAFLSATPGGDEPKAAAERALATAWSHKFYRGLEPPREGDTVPVEAWYALAREVIVETLSDATGLQLKLSLSADRTLIVCRIRAPMKLLEKQAAAERLPLQFRGEIDPGYGFWTESETAEEARDLTREEAEDILQRLYNAGKLSPNDITIFEDETKALWSRRVHALERVADAVPSANRFAAHVPFDGTARLRHLYCEYPSVRGRTLFLPSQRLGLTASLVGKHLSVDHLEAVGVVAASYALHDAARGETLTADTLRRRWVWWYSCDPRRIGAPMGSVPYMDSDEAAPVYARPFCQPVGDVRAYFGDRIALVTAFSGFFTAYLTFPATLGLAYTVYVSLTPARSRGPAFALAVCLVTPLWGFAVHSGWCNERACLRLMWGTDAAKVPAEPAAHRAAHYADSTSAPLVRSAVSNRLVTHFTPTGALVLRGAALVLLGVCVAVQLAAVGAVCWLQATVFGGKWYGDYVAVLLAAVQIQVLKYGFTLVVAPALADLGNHATDDDHALALSTLSFAFNVSNAFAAPLFVLFLKGPLIGCALGGCISEARSLLIAIVGVQALHDLVVVVGPTAGRMWAEWSDVKAQYKAAQREVALEEGRPDELLDTVDEEPFETELTKLAPAAEPAFDPLSEAALQFGYVACFTGPFPLLPLVYLVLNLFKLRTSAYALCKPLCRRPVPKPLEAADRWRHAVEGMAVLGAVVNAAILAVSGSLGGFRATAAAAPVAAKLLTFLLAEQALLVAKAAGTALAASPEAAGEGEAARQRFVAAKHTVGFGEDTDARAGGVFGGGGGGGHGHVDLDSMDLGRMAGGGARDVSEINSMQARLRDFSRELALAKERLADAMAAEIYNEKTGIGESIHGLPLGCLTVKLVTLVGFEIRPKNASVVISLRSTKPGEKESPGPAPWASKPARAGERTAALDVNQQVQLAPIRTHDAEVIFDVMDQAADPKRVGTCKLHLRDLADQLEANKTLEVHKRNERGTFALEDCRLYLRVQFQYSKILPLKNRIYEVQDQQRRTEKDITLLRLGKKKAGA